VRGAGGGHHQITYLGILLVLKIGTLRVGSALLSSQNIPSIAHRAFSLGKGACQACHPTGCFLDLFYIIIWRIFHLWNGPGGGGHGSPGKVAGGPRPLHGRHIPPDAHQQPQVGSDRRRPGAETGPSAQRTIFQFAIKFPFYLFSNLRASVVSCQIATLGLWPINLFVEYHHFLCFFWFGIVEVKLDIFLKLGRFRSYFFFLYFHFSLSILMMIVGHHWFHLIPDLTVLI